MGNGVSVLHQAALEGDLSKLCVAVQQASTRIDDQEPTKGWTALHITSVKGYDTLTRELLNRGADPNVADKEGRTPLHLAAGAGHAQVVTDLVRRRADASLRDMEGKSALDLALAGDHAAAAAVLRQAGAASYLSAASPGASPTARQAAQAGPYGYPSVPQPGAPPGPGGYWDPAGAAAGAPPADASAPSAPPAPGYLDYLSGAPGLYPAPAYEAPPYPPAPSGAGGGGGGGGYPSLPGAYSAEAAAGAYSGAPAAGGYPAAVPAGSGGGGGGGGGAYPQVDGYGAAGAAAALGGAHPPPPGAAGAAVATADSDDWGGSVVRAEWGQRAAPPPPDGGAAAAPAPGAPPSAAAAPPQQQPSPEAAAAAAAAASEAARQRLEKLDIGSAVGSAARAAAGAIGGAAMAGAKNLFANIIKNAQGGGGGGGRGGGGSQGQRPGGGSFGGAGGSGAALAGPSNRHYTYEDLYKATNGFCEANKLGSGGYGPVYRGVLDGVPVAIKCLDTSEGAMQGEQEFLQEAQILGRLHHPHIVLLIGVCPQCCMLVYELLDNGNLEEHILGNRGGDLLWQDRVRITAEVASALLFLHSAPEPIIHLDLKPANILLSRNLTSKIGDVGLSRLAPSLAPGGQSTVLDTRLVGTPSFMDPEYLRTGRFGPKSDIFSLGVVMMQLLTGRDARRVITDVEAALKRSLADPASFAEVVDPRAGAWPLVEAASFAHLAARCAALGRGDRPDLRSEVLPGLLQLAERAAQYRAGPPPAGGGAGGAALGSGAGAPPVAFSAGPAGAYAGGGARSLRRIASANASGAEPPTIFICPITQDIMDDPVFASDGFTYEREAIAGWIANHNTSPMTNLKLESGALIPNHALRGSIREWLERHPEYAQAAGLVPAR